MVWYSAEINAYRGLKVSKLIQGVPDLSWGDPSYLSCREPTAQDKLPVLLPAQKWFSKKEMPPESITMVTQFSLERMRMLQSQCSVWKDRIAAVVYVPFVHGFGCVSPEVKEINGTSVDEIISLLDDFHQKMESSEDMKCALDLKLELEFFESMEDPQLGLYPFNALRNQALLLARTELVFLLDVDFVPSSSFQEIYQYRPHEYAELVKMFRERRRAMVIPAFQTYLNKTEGRRLAVGLAKLNKEDVVNAYQQGMISGFQLTSYEKGHNSTNYSRWITADKPYSIQYKQGYEPYVVVSRRHIPFYDERFRGYSRDKIVHINHLAVQYDTEFLVHPYAFVIHSPHRKAATFKTTKATGQWDLLLDLYKGIKREIDKKQFVPVTSFASVCPHYFKAKQTN